MDKKSIYSIIFLIVVLLGCIALALWTIPKTSNISLSLDAVKLDESGKEIGTAKIEIQGSHLNYLFQEDRINLVIAPFDGLTNIRLITNHSDSAVPSTIGGDYLYLGFGIWGAPFEDMDLCSLYYTKDFECFSFKVPHPEGDVYYVASASGDYTTQEIVKAFNGLVPGL